MYNTVNQRTKTTLADNSYWDYAYDDLGQLDSGGKHTSAGAQISGRQFAYDQDEIGNRISANATTYTANNVNQYTAINSQNLTYDTDGNMLSDGVWTYTWDGENRLTRMVSTNLTKTLSFEYDWQGRRIAKKVWNNTTGTGTPATHLKYIYDGWNLIAELNGNSNNAKVRTYTWGLDISGSTTEAGGVGGLLFIDDNTNGVHFVSYDLNGNVMGLIKATNGTISASYEYGPFGELLSNTGTMSSSNPFRFSTKYRDNETDLYYYGYRYYSPSLGRWISRDPIEEQGELNLYGFVNNDPVNRVDWLGQWGSDVHLYETLNWASQSGYPPEASWNIGLADNEVDGGWSGGGRGWNPIIGDQSYHFNRNLNGGRDSRLEHYVKHLQNAKALCTWPRNDFPINAAKELGISLHPLQDWFAHGDYGLQEFLGIHDIHNSHSPQTEFGSPGNYPDDTSLDAVGSVDGRPAGEAIRKGYINERGMLYPGAYVIIPVYREWAVYEKGNKRITLTQKETKVALKDFRNHVKKHGGCKCKCYFNANK